MQIFQLILVCTSLLGTLLYHYLAIHDLMNCQPGACGVTSFFYVPFLCISLLLTVPVYLSSKKVIKDPHASREKLHSANILLKLIQISFLIWTIIPVSLVLLSIFEQAQLYLLH